MTQKHFGKKKGGVGLKKTTAHSAGKRANLAKPVKKEKKPLPMAPTEKIVTKTIGNVDQVKDQLNGKYLFHLPFPRVAFIGRSNVGKSSLINALTRSKVAYVSAKPGKTKLLHFHQWVEKKVFFVDLPGYGFAKASQDERAQWAKLIESYLKKDENLAVLLVLMDSRHGITAVDQEAIQYLQSLGATLAFVFTKYDRLKNQSERAQVEKKVLLECTQLGWQEVPRYWISIHDESKLNILRREFSI